jgi:hypothetical protein
MAPRIEPLANGNHQFVVRGKPFLALAAELNNSSLSSSTYMKDVFPKMQAQGFNTLLGAVQWEQIEPEEGKFDFDELDKVLEDARAHDMHLVLLWFGSFKNGQSSCVPPWVKVDDRRFPRAELRMNGKTQEVVEVLSVFHSEAMEADAKAFGKLMAHIKEFDEEHETVIMVQVENEVGLLGDSRDRSTGAQKVFDAGVPADFVERVCDDWDRLNETIKPNLSRLVERRENASGLSWSALLGDSLQTDEIFMAYHYALYIQHVAVRGKAEYDIPYYANAWLRNDTGEEGSNTTVTDGKNPGNYPSGGPIDTVLDIWHLFAPALALLAPDIYMPDYATTCRNYRHRGQPLFIPEQRGDIVGAVRIWEALGSFGAIGTAPFGIDTLPAHMNAFEAHNQLLKQVSGLILKARQDGLKMTGFYFDEFEAGSKDRSPTRTVEMGDWRLEIARAHVFGHPEAGYGLIIQTGSDRFLLIGAGFQVSFKSSRDDTSYTGIMSFVEKEVVDPASTELKSVRFLNGDETRSGRFAVMPSSNPDYAKVPVAILIPARTRIAEVRPYCLKQN